MRVEKLKLDTRVYEEISMNPKKRFLHQFILALYADRLFDKSVCHLTTQWRSQ